MAQAHATELALIKCIASSLVHIIGKDNLLFVTPYFIEYDKGLPVNLRMPDLDHPFSEFLGGDREHNEKLWIEYHNNGRERAAKDVEEEVSIWKHILERCSHKFTGETLEINPVSFPSAEFTRIENDPKEFHPNRVDGATEYVALIAEVRQSSGILTGVKSHDSLIAAISMVLKPEIADQKVVVGKIKEYLEFLQLGKYLTPRHDLNIASMIAKDWMIWRRIAGSNHWGDTPEGFKQFRECSVPLVAQIKADYGVTLDEANQPGDQGGRPSLRDLAQNDYKKGRIESVIINRLKEVIRGRCCDYEVNVELLEGCKGDYLWFNAIALADTFANAIRAYSELDSETRLSVSKTVGNKRLVICNVRIASQANDEQPEPITASVSIFELGLSGASVHTEKQNGGTHLKDIVKCATITGAQLIFLRWFDHLAIKFTTYVLPKIHGKIEEVYFWKNIREATIEEMPASMPKDLTGFFFEIMGEASKTPPLRNKFIVIDNA